MISFLSQFGEPGTPRRAALCEEPVGAVGAIAHTNASAAEPPLRRPRADIYPTQHPQLKGFGNTRSCGKCGQFSVPGSGKVLHVWGWCCGQCVKGKAA